MGIAGAGTHEMIEAAEDVVRRLRATADDIERDVVALRGGRLAARVYCVHRGALWGSVAGVAALAASCVGFALT